MREGLGLAPLRRFQYKVYERGDCWEWRGARSKNGYGVMAIFAQLLGAHRLAFEMAKCPIPFGFHIDHLCRHRWCVKPSHLEAVTCKTNVQRERKLRWITKRCPKGHEFDYFEIRRSGPYKGNIARRCSLCRHEWYLRYKERAQ